MLTGFTAGLSLITIAELGDKSFFIAVLLAMRHPKALVFTGVMAALTAMTVISVLIGEASNFLPKIFVHYAVVILLFIFGISLLWKARHMPAKTCLAELAEVEADLKQHPFKWAHGSKLGILLESFSLTFLGEWGDRTQFSTATLAAGYDASGVTLGAILGHGICTAIAITCGCLLADRISERNLTYMGGILFLVFAAVAFAS